MFCKIKVVSLFLNNKSENGSYLFTVNYNRTTVPIMFKKFFQKAIYLILQSCRVSCSIMHL